VCFDNHYHRRATQLACSIEDYDNNNNNNGNKQCRLYPQRVDGIPADPVHFQIIPPGRLDMDGNNHDDQQHSNNSNEK